VQKYNGQLIRQFASSVSGNAASGVTVAVRKQSDNSLATLYVDNNIAGATLPNPLTTSSTGHFAFYADDGVYTLTFSDTTPQQVIQLQDVGALQDQFDAAVLNAGYIPSGTFTAGAALTQANQVMSDGSSYWRWDGSFPKTVGAGSSPTPTGVGGWIVLSDFALRGDLSAANSTVLVGGVEARDLTLECVTPEMFGAVGDGVTDDTEALYQAHASGKSVLGKSGSTYLVKKSNYINLLDGMVYDYRFATVKVDATCTISDTVGDGFGRYANNLFYRNSTAAVAKSIVVRNLAVDCQARKVNGIGGGDTSGVRDNHAGWIVVQNYKFSSVGEVAGGGGPEVLTNATCGSSINMVGYQLNLENIDVYDCGHGVVGFSSKVFRARNVRTYFCGVSRDFTSWYNCASLLCRTSEVIDIEGCYSYVTGGTSYFLSVGASLSSKLVRVRNCSLVGCGLSGVGAGTRSYVTYQSKVELIDVEITIDGWCCAINADLHSGMKLSIEDLYNSSCDNIKVNAVIDYLAPWESFNETTKEVDGSYNVKKKKGQSVGSQYAIACYAVKTGTNNVIKNAVINADIANHQGGGVYIGYCDRASVNGYFDNNGWQRQSDNTPFATLIISSVYAQENSDAAITAKVNKQSQAVVEEKTLCTPVIIRGNARLALDLEVTNQGNQLYAVRDIVDADGTELKVIDIKMDSPLLSGGFAYLIDNSAGAYSKVRKIISDKQLLCLISGSREISPFTSIIKETSIASGAKTITLLGAKCFDGRVVEAIANGTWALNVAPRSGETIDGSASTVNVPVNTSKRFISVDGLWKTL
jgi:hypothetical protein